MAAQVVPTVELRGGVAMPLLGFGTWQLRGPQAREAVGTALEAGYRHVRSNADVLGFSLAPDEVARIDGLGRT